MSEQCRREADSSKWRAALQHPFTKPGRSTIYQLLRLNRHGSWDIETSSPTISRSSLSSFLAGFALGKAVLPGFVPVAALSCALSSSGTFGLTGLTLQALPPPSAPSSRPSAPSSHPPAPRSVLLTLEPALETVNGGGAHWPLVPCVCL